MRVTIATLAGAWGGASLAALISIALDLAHPFKVGTNAVIDLALAGAVLGALVAAAAVGVAGALGTSRERVRRLGEPRG